MSAGTLDAPRAAGEDPEMASTTVNPQITDSVSQVNTKVLGDAPAIPIGGFYQATERASAGSEQGAAGAPQQGEATAQDDATTGEATTKEPG